MESIPAPAKTGKSWPLFALAALSLVPVLGILPGFAVACWGLVTDRPRGILAAALGGGGAILNVAIVASFGMAALRKTPGYDGVTNGIARTELDTLVVHLEEYNEEHGRYPASLDILRSNVSRPLPLIDHSGSLFNTTATYQYRATGDGRSYHLTGVGQDGIADTPDDVVPSHLRQIDSLPIESDTGSSDD